MKLLVLGKGGSGKSALINGLRKIGREDSGAAPESAAGCSGTDSVRRYVTRRDDVEMEVYDTPGLDDKKSARQVLDEAFDVTDGDVNVVLFCVALSRGLRIDDSYTELISVLAETFDQSLWSQLIFVLTFAEDTTQRGQKVRNVTEQLTRVMMSAGAERAAAESVTVLPAGYTRQQETEDWSEKIIDACRKRAISKCFFSPRKKTTAVRGITFNRRHGLAVVALALGAYVVFGTAGLVGALVFTTVMGSAIYLRRRNEML